MNPWIRGAAILTGAALLAAGIVSLALPTAVLAVGLTAVAVGALGASLVDDPVEQLAKPLVRGIFQPAYEGCCNIGDRLRRLVGLPPKHHHDEMAHNPTAEAAELPTEDTGHGLPSHVERLMAQSQDQERGR